MSNTLIVGEQKVEYELIGHGKPCIIFLNGFGGSFNAHWGKVTSDISDVGILLLYNRTGIGGSSKATTKQSGDVVIATLREILKSLQLESPYVLVCTSMGGLFANLFARMYPDETQAVIFVESSHPDEDKVLVPLFTPLNRALYKLQMSIFRLFPNSEFNMFERSCELIRGAAEFPDIPIVVLTGAKPSRQATKTYIEAHVALDEELAAMTSSGQHVISVKSGHTLVITEPELVVDPIRSVISNS